nr:zinc finger, CCHC-type [Tanacetum cinerariifolium]
MTCWKCGKPGHLKEDCRVKKNNGVSTSGSDKGLKTQVHNKAVVRLPEPKKKILGEKGIDCIFIGYVKHSKAYRLHVIEPNDFVSVNSIIESKDVIFDENKFSLIPRPKDIVSSSSGTQGSIMENNTWVLSDLPPGCNPLRQKEGIDYFGTYAPVACISTIRLLIALAATHNPVIHQMVVKTIFLNGDLEEEMYMKQPERIVMPGCGPVSTSIEASIKLMPHMGKPVNQLEYSRAIECLMYAMTSTRPNITYAIEKLSRFTSNPSNHHWEAIIKASKKQTCITDSTMESKFVALAAARKEARDDNGSGSRRVLVYPYPHLYIISTSVPALLPAGRICREMVDEFAPPKFFTSVCGMEHDQLFTEFNVGAAHQMSLSAEVRMRPEYNVKEGRRLMSVVEKHDELLKAKDGEIENLKEQLLLKEAEAVEAICLCAEASNFDAVEKSIRDEVNALKERNTILEKEWNALDVKATDLEASATDTERELTNLNV